MPIEKARHQTAVETPDYSNGPSALDKAASLFFFSEIARGACEFVWTDCRA
jgi:NADH dehydrogenase (ubiquinone) Fe-S protein 8